MAWTVVRASPYAARSSWSMSPSTSPLYSRLITSDAAMRVQASSAPRGVAPVELSTRQTGERAGRKQIPRAGPRRVAAGKCFMKILAHSPALANRAGSNVSPARRGSAADKKLPRAGKAYFDREDIQARVYPAAYFHRCGRRGPVQERREQTG